MQTSKQFFYFSFFFAFLETYFLIFLGDFFWVIFHVFFQIYWIQNCCLWIMHIFQDVVFPFLLFSLILLFFCFFFAFLETYFLNFFG